MNTTRTAMADRVNIGQVWRRRRDGRTFSVRQVWRVDRQVRMESPNLYDCGCPDGRVTVSFSDLRRFWELVS